MTITYRASTVFRGFYDCKCPAGTQPVAHTHLPCETESLRILTTDNIGDAVAYNQVQRIVDAAYENALDDPVFDATAADWTVIVREGVAVAICSLQKGQQFAFATLPYHTSSHFASVKAIITLDSKHDFDTTLRNFPCLRMLSQRSVGGYAYGDY